jgi:hypothetical protein
LLDLPARDPEVAPSESHPAFSLAFHDSEVSPVLVRVTEAVVPVVPKLTCRGEIASCACDVLVEGTDTETDTTSDPPPRSALISTSAVCVPVGSPLLSAENLIVRVEFPHRVPEVASSDSHRAVSFALQEKGLLEGFVSVIDPAVDVLPKSTRSGDTSSFEPLASAASISVGEEELQAAETTTRRAVKAT